MNPHRTFSPLNAMVAAFALAALAVPGRSLAQVSIPTAPPYTIVSATGNSYSVAVGDMNGDGNNDVVIGLIDNTQGVSVVPGDGQGGFGNPTNFSAFPPLPPLPPFLPPMW